MPALPITDYFRDNVLVKRPYIRLEWCEAAVRDPIRTQVQSDDGRIRHWIWVDALGRYTHHAPVLGSSREDPADLSCLPRSSSLETLSCPLYLRVVTLADGQTIHNAFPDRRFKP
jgi:hypothetical protein